MGIETQADDLQRLVERIEAATGPDRQIDYDILCVVDPRALATGLLPGDPKFTASIDAAVSLVPEDCQWIFDSHHNIARISRHYFVDSYGPDWVDFQGEGASPALAICAAALRARITQEKSNG